MKQSKILLVDDSALARRTLLGPLQDAGYAVEEATDGAQALERYFLHRHDLVVLDMVMHGMYGLDVLKELRKLSPDVPVIVVTADIQNRTEAEVRLAGVAGFVTKPVNRDAFVKLVRRILGEKPE